MRGKAATLLAEIGETGAIPAITKLLSDINREVRYDVVEALGILLSGTRKAPAQLVRLLSDRDPLVRIQTLDSLSSIGDKRRVRFVARSLHDLDPLVRAHAAECIADLGGVQYRRHLRSQLRKDRNPLVQIGILDALHRMGERDMFKRLVEKLKSDSYRVRCATANSIRALDVNPRNRQMALSALRQARRRPIARADLEAVRRALRSLLARL